ncbi:MAG: DNA-binding response regulator [Verrucomicrobia bacterium]|nr:MAG: DNA-binding response regulator [Verrucomicrobiota bacterium]
MASSVSEKPIVHVVDDDDSLRKAVTRLLRAAGYDVRAYASAGEFVLANRENNRRGCVLLDVRMPGPSGLDLQEALAREEEPLPVIFLTAYGDVPTSVRAMKAGAVDFLTKPIKRDVLLSAVRIALARDLRLHTSHEQRRDLRMRFTKLTPRERDVFDLVVAGRLNKQIAAELGMAERTVKAHRAQVMAKMQATSLAELVHLADKMQYGIL